MLHNLTQSLVTTRLKTVSLNLNRLHNKKIFKKIISCTVNCKFIDQDAWSVTTPPMATYWWHSQGSPLCFAVIHMLCSGVRGVSCPRHTTTLSSVPTLWCQTERRRGGYGVKKEGGKRDEGIKEQAGCVVETSGWKRLQRKHVRQEERVWSLSNGRIREEEGEGWEEEESFVYIGSVLSESLENEL